VVEKAISNYTEINNVIFGETPTYRLTLKKLLKMQAKNLLLVKESFYYEDFVNVMKRFLEIWVPVDLAKDLEDK